MSHPAPGPRVVAVHEVIDGWPEKARTSFAFWVGHMAPDLVEEYDQIIRRLEAGIADRAARSGSRRT